MKITVINGSPRGKYSTTLQTVLYLQAVYKNCEFTVLNAGQGIRSLEKDFSPVKEALSAADIVLFAYPVYTFIAPSQLQRFIELLKESGIVLTGKFAAQITTSKHFFDVTAHKYIEQNCADMGLKYLGGLSADMEDLLSKKGQKDAEDFFDYITYCVKQDIYMPYISPIKAEHIAYEKRFSPIPKSGRKKTVIVTNRRENDAALAAMIQDFIDVFSFETRVINIAEFPFKGGCLGCLNCASDGQCVYTDGFERLLREDIQAADAVIYAFTIKDHSMGADFKLFDDRQFCNGHRTVTMGKPAGYIINGDYAAEPNLRMVIEGRSEVGHNFLAGQATDAFGIKNMALRLEYALNTGFVLPQNFYGVGGLKIFRDLIYLMRGMMKADHKFYKQHGFYDFPQKKPGTIFKMKLVGMLAASPGIKKKMGNKMNEGMIAPYKKVIEEAKSRAE